MMPFRTALAALVALSLGGCGAITSISDATTPLDAYQLRVPADLPSARSTLQRDLVVETPTTGGALDTDRIMIKPGLFETQYLPRARWTDSAPVLLQTLMIRAFENTNGLRYVGRRPLAGPSEFLLVTELTDFQAVLDPATELVTAEVRFTSHLVRQSDETVIGSRTIAKTAPAASTETLDVVAATDAAAGAALQELTRWALGRMGVGVSG